MHSAKKCVFVIKNQIQIPSFSQSSFSIQEFEKNIKFSLILAYYMLIELIKLIINYISRYLRHLYSIYSAFKELLSINYS